MGSTARIVGVGLALATAVLLWAAPANAYETYVSNGEFEVCTHFRETVIGIAADEASGDVLVPCPGDGPVEVYDGSGTVVTELSGVEAVAVAVDQSNGDAYAIQPGVGAVSRFTRTSISPLNYSLDTGYTGPSSTDVGSFNSPIAIDPTSGDLLVADTGFDRVERFAADGQLISTFDGSGAPEGPFHSLQSITVGPDGSIYVGDLLEGSTLFGGKSAVEKFDAAGAYEASSDAPEIPHGLAVDPVTGNLVVSGGASLGPAPKIYVFRGQTLIQEIPTPAEHGERAVQGLALIKVPSGTLEGTRLFVEHFRVSNGIPGEEQQAGQFLASYDGVLLPDVTMAAPTVTATSAHLEGTVNPLGVDATYSFEYAEAGSAAWTPTPAKDAGEGEVPVAVEADLSALAPNTAYRFRLSASNASGTHATEPIAIETLKSPPAVIEGQLRDLMPTKATVVGTINPFGLPTAYFVEWGPTTAYGMRSPAGSSITVGSGRVAAAIQQTIYGLTPGGTYHYRIVADSSAGRTLGDDVEFVAPAAEPHRVYEQVSPVEKGGGILSTSGAWLNTGDGESIIYQSRSAPNTPSQPSAPLVNLFQSRRSAGGWSFRSIDAPVSIQPRGPGQVFIQTVLAVSEDQSAALVASNEALAAGAVTGSGNLYREDLRTGAYTLIATGPPDWFGTELTNFLARALSMGGSSNFDRIYFDSAAVLNPEAERASSEFAFSFVYEWSSTGGLRLVSKQADGSAVSGLVEAPEYTYAPQRFVSADGSVAAFGTQFGFVEGTFVVRAGVSEPISVSQRPGGSTEPQSAELLGMSEDGRYVFFRVRTGTGLTEDAPDESNDVYRYDTTTRNLLFISVARGNQPGKGVSADGRTFYFIDFGKLYVWRNGVVRAVTPGTWEPGSSRLGDEFSMSADGRYLAFTGTLDADGGQMYLYDADTRELACASCGPPGHAASMGVRSAYNKSNVGGAFPKTVSDTGQVFFTTRSGLVSGDVNGQFDVYEYDHGILRLISGGDVDANSFFASVSDSGRDVFFVTEQRLVTQDQDRSSDLYDARTDGGIPSQNPVLQPTCSSRDCVEVTETTPPGVGPASEGLSPKPASRATKKKKVNGHCPAPKKGKGKKQGTSCRQRSHGKGSGHGKKTDGKSGGAR